MRTSLVRLVLAVFIAGGWSWLTGWMLASAQPALPPASEGAQPEEILTGWFTIVWGDGDSERPASVQTFFLTDEAGQSIELALDEARLEFGGSALASDRRRVTVAGAWMRAPASTDGGALRVRTIQPAESAIAQPDAPSVTGAQPWVSLMCKFADVVTETKPLTFFQGMYSSSKPGLDHYWREQSFNLINLSGSNAFGWYTLPYTRGYYIKASANLTALFQDCTGVADSTVNFSSYVGINMMFNDNLDGYAWGGGRYATLDGVTKLWYTTWEPPWGYRDVSVIEHEMGHGFGLPHSSGMYGQTYDNAWDVMSKDRFNCGAATDPTYGCMAQHTIAYYKDRLAWITATQKTVVSPGQRATIVLERLAQPQTSNLLLVRIPITTSTTHFYSLESRDLAGYDAKLAGRAVVIHDVLTTRSIPANVFDIDKNGNTGDAGAMWIPGEKFTDTNGITVTIIATTSTGHIVLVENQPSPYYVNATGPVSGLVQISRTFTAVSNLATQPITYVWQATGQSATSHVNGLTDTVQFTWTTSGRKTITVTASNGGTTVSGTWPIDIYAPVQAGFVAAPTSGLRPLRVVFTNTSTGDYVSSKWDFGDGVTSTLTHPTHTYTLSRTFNVTLTVSGPGGSQSKSATITALKGNEIYLPLLIRGL